MKEFKFEILSDEEFEKRCDEFWKLYNELVNDLIDYKLTKEEARKKWDNMFNVCPLGLLPNTSNIENLLKENFPDWKFSYELIFNSKEG